MFAQTQGGGRVGVLTPGSSDIQNFKYIEVVHNIIAHVIN